jgi:hypothetical protein
MRILIITQYFWPEYFRINDLAKELSKKYEIEVLTGYPNYPHGQIYKEFLLNKEKFKELEKVKIHRVPIYPRKSGNQFYLILNYFSYLISAVFFGLFLFHIIREKQPQHFMWAPYKTAVNPSGKNHLDKLLGINNAQKLFELPLPQFIANCTKLTHCAGWPEQMIPYLLY